MKILHNPRCRKSRETLKLIEDKGIEPIVVLYLEDSLSFAQLKKIVKMLDMKPKDLVRKGEAIYKDKYKGNEYSDKEWIEIMVANPKLIERPIVIKDGKAVIGRPPENVLTLI